MYSTPRQVSKPYRQRNGCILGVLGGLATWSGIPAVALRVIALILLFKVGLFIASVTYLGLALLMPVQAYS